MTSRPIQFIFNNDVNAIHKTCYDILEGMGPLGHARMS